MTGDMRGKSGPGNLIMAAAFYAVFGILAPFLSGLAGGMVSGAHALGNDAARVIAASIIQLIGIAVMVTYIYKTKGRIIPAAGTLQSDPIESRRLFMFTILFSYSGIIFAHGSVDLIMGLINMHAGSDNLDVHIAIAFIYAVIIIPIAEEVLYRGIIYESVRDKAGAAFAMISSSVLFAAVHGSLSGIVVALIMGLLFAFLYEMYCDIRINVLVHAAHNILAILYPDALTISEGGPLVRIPVTLLAGAAAIYMGYRIFFITRS